jgi:N-acetylglucosamine-6-phosphate deacetylase
MMTLAPEMQSEEVIDLLNKAGIIISIGHSMANFKEATVFFEKIPAATHLFNAMPLLHHRQPGLVGAIFSKKPYTSIVADGIHVNFEMIKLAKKILGDKMFLITDAVTACNYGPYQHVFNHDYYVMPDGTLSGSALTMLSAIKNCVNYVHIDLDEAIRMATTYPANLINIKNHELKNGSVANLVLLDADLKIQYTIMASQIYKN